MRECGSYRLMRSPNQPLQMTAVRISAPWSAEHERRGRASREPASPEWTAKAADQGQKTSGCIDDAAPIDSRDKHLIVPLPDRG